MSFSDSKTVLVCGGCGEEMEELASNRYRCSNCEVRVDDRNQGEILRC